jgi:nucleotide-binding universal stress UspA family protein
LFLQDEAKKSVKAQTEIEKLKRKNDAAARRLLDDYRDNMVQKGIDEQRIEMVTRPRDLGLAKDILEFGQNGRYDAIVVGRRGLSRLQEMYMGSVTANIMEHSKVLPVWLIDGEVRSNRIMVAVDGSEGALRAVDHASFMLSQNPDSRLSLVHVTSSARDYCEVNFDDEPQPELEDIVVRGDKACIDQFYAHALQKFKDAGISESQLELKTTQRNRNAGKAILAEAKEGSYGTVVIGKSGIDKAFFMGSVSRYIINRASNSALWIVN